MYVYLYIYICIDVFFLKRHIQITYHKHKPANKYIQRIGRTNRSNVRKRDGKYVLHCEKYIVMRTSEVLGT